MQEESRTDLTSLSHENGKGPSEDAIVHLLHSRYNHNLPYTRLGSSTLIVVNPYQPLEILNDATLEAYADACYRSLSDSKPIMQPHVYDLAARVYFHMRRTGQDQSIILSGITGSGKSTTRAHILEQILQLSTHTKKERKLQQQIRQSSAILELFGHARTSQNKSGSQFGQFQEIQLNERGHLIGAQTLSFAFDKYRLLAPQKGRNGERSFHVFYSLLAGTTVEEKNALYINFGTDHFQYLNNQQLTTDDEIQFGNLKTALKTCGFKAANVTAMFQLLSAILHMGNLQFTETEDSMVQDACAVKNLDVLQAVAALLGVSPHKLETALTYKLRLIRNELCTVFLNPKAAAEQRDSFACALYQALFAWVVETLNSKLCNNDPANFIGLLDLPGFQNFSKSDDNGFEQFCFNFANERLHQFLIQRQFNDDNEAIQDGLLLPKVITMDNVGCLDLLGGNNGNNGGTSGVIGTINKASGKLQAGASDATDANLLADMQRQHNGHPSFISAQAFSFGIHHYSGTVHYSVDRFLDRNLDSVSPDFVSLLRDNSSNNFVSNLFQSTAMATESHPKDDRTIVKAQLTSKPTRAPSMKRKNTKRLQRKNTTRQQAIAEEPENVDDSTTLQDNINIDEDIKVSTVLDQLYTTLSDLFVTMAGTQLYNVIHIRPNDIQSPDSFENNRVKNQVRSLLLSDLTLRKSKEYIINYTFPEFTTRYGALISTMVDVNNRSDREQTESLYAFMNWNEQHAFIGHELIWLNYDPWKELEDGLRISEKESRAKAKGLDGAELMAAGAAVGAVTGATMGENASDMQDFHTMPIQGGQPIQQFNQFGEPIHDEYSYDNSMLLAPPHMAGTHSVYGGSYAASEADMKRDDMASQWGEESEWGINGLGEAFGPNMDMSKMVEDYQSPQIENVEEVPITTLRIWWVRFVWLMTWWIPSPLLIWIGKMKREDIRMAWREKVTLCLLIFLFSCVVIFFIVGLGYVMCPGTSTMYSPANVGAHGVRDDNYVSVYGQVYDVTHFALTEHGTTAFPANADTMSENAGQDLTASFPLPLTEACVGLVTSDIVQITANATLPKLTFSHSSGSHAVDSSMPQMKDSKWYWNTFLPTMKLYKKGTVVISVDQINSDFKSWGRKAIAIYGKIYDITDYLSTANYYGQSNSQYHFLNSAVETIFTTFGGTDASAQWDQYFKKLDAETQAMNMNCLNNAFYIGDVDVRDTARCTFSNYLLLSFACLMCLTIVVKFLAALQFGGAPTPEDHDKFVICQVPCYTEDEESLRKTIDSLTVLNYDDRRKLLMIIADGMIMGSGNDRPTPRIVLDVLGYDTSQDPEPLMFKSIGEGSKQLNYGKIYSGLYECEGHVVPYLVVVKVGKASERAKPGNRGKRDSQMILMNFLNKVHFDSPMTPMELEMFHQIKNVIGVHPSFYEYILMVDSDTEVEANALNHMISTMLHDGKIIGLCGETKLSNEDRSWTTMIQVYEYYISHHLSKAFESLFGSVTCLPGCFCMYRIRTPVKNEPLIISPKIINEYKDNHVDTLHKKNLLHLGEDRYLTTLMMKHFPNYKMKFTPHALCQTVAPDKWKILLSQRRRWINSTIHNLLEVVLLPDLCGFCCFSMRFIVLLDLIGTLTLPVTVVYLVYLLYVIISGNGPFPKIALIMLAGVYALQAILFILKRQWQHIGWMIFYILAIPVFSFFLPVYSFWHFDDFSWGNTRVVVGDNKQKKIIVTDDEKFDEKMIPLKKWSVYEQELWEVGSSGSRDNRSYYSASKGGNNMVGSGGSQYGGSQFGGSQYGGMNNDNGYDYYRDTKVNEKQNRSQVASYMPSYAGSVIAPPQMGPGSVYDGQQDYMMMQPPSFPQQRPMSESVHSFGGHDDFERQSMAGRNSNMYGGMPPPQMAMSQYSVPMSTNSFVPPGFPNDAEIFEAIKHILSTADLMTITKKQVRTQLSTQFGFDMNIKKDFINASIESVLQESGRM